ncbi:MAG: hypothetical protein QHJ34_13845 [bacterium]|jgi:hypothetical protein|nr:hypothetical protein [candidate division KSB1 bacterium]MDH7561294.1 hypothetical protein [bacterium]
MRRVGLFLSILLLFAGTVERGVGQTQTYPKRLKRSESFLGIHFDFHAGDDCKEIGKYVSREMVEYIIDTVKPDYVQCDCKGHPGVSSYMTKVGHQAPGFVLDPLRIWREATAERGVALYVHYSGVWDEKAVQAHPDWACVNNKGEASKQKTSVFGPYVDQLLIRQLKELADEYGIDGVWVDGDCWAVESDYSPRALEAFKAKTGIAEAPKSPEDPHWFEFLECQREGYRSYLNHYVTELHAHRPEFQIASNWSFTSFMPEAVSVPVDFLSGDYLWRNSVNSARFEGRVMAQQGKPWDLMAWSFTWTDQLYSTKSVPQLQQEAAIILALGGGFQAYSPQKRDGSIRRWQMRVMAEVAQFCRARQELCHKAELVPQIGLILSTSAFYRESPKPFAGWTEEVSGIKGILQCLLDGQHVVDVVMEHHLRQRARQYPLLIYPEWSYIDPEFKALLLEYVASGGRLLVIGPRAAKLFEKELGVTCEGEPQRRVNGLAYGGFLAGINSEYQPVQLGPGVRPFGEIYENNDFFGEPAVAASIADYGQGQIAAVYLNLGERYMNLATTVSRDFLSALVRELFPSPLVEVTGSHNVDVTVSRKEGRLLINLVNTAGLHSDSRVSVFDQIPAVGPLTVSVRQASKPKAVSLMPSGMKLQFHFRDGKLTLTVPRLEIHEVVALE